MLTKVVKKCTPFHFTETLKLVEILSANAQHLRFALNAHFRRTLERMSEEVLSASSDGSTATEKRPERITCDNLHHSELRVFGSRNADARSMTHAPPSTAVEAIRLSSDLKDHNKYGASFCPHAQCLCQHGGWTHIFWPHNNRELSPDSC